MGEFSILVVVVATQIYTCDKMTYFIHTLYYTNIKLLALILNGN